MSKIRTVYEIDNKRFTKYDDAAKYEQELINKEKLQKVKDERLKAIQDKLDEVNGLIELYNKDYDTALTVECLDGINNIWKDFFEVVHGKKNH